MKRYGVSSRSVRRCRSSLALALFALLALAPTASALPDQPAPATLASAPVVASSDQVIVQWVAGAGRRDKAEARADAEVSSTSSLGDPQFQLVTAQPGQSASEAVAELRANPAVAVAERDRYIGTDALPDDPLLGQLWGLQNQGLGIGGVTGAVVGADIDIGDAWERTVGDPAIVVADIDSGYRFEHPDLAAVAWNNPGETANGLDDDGNGIVDDLHGADFIGANGDAPSKDGDPTDDDLISGGHGVHTAGTIGAEGDNGVGITGVAQNVRIMPLRVCSRFPSLSDSRCSLAAIVAAINYAGAKGARVANMSLGSTGTVPQTEVNAIAENPEVLFVVSAGNDSEDNDSEPHYPCNFRPQLDASPPVPGAIDNIVCVAATDQADGLAGFSDRGATSVDLGAPGTEVLSTYPFTTPFAEDFAVDNFSTQWPATGANGGFERSDEAPLTSFGMTDATAAVAANTVRETTSAAITVPPNGGCRLSQTRRVVLGGTAAFRYSVLLDGVEEAVTNPSSTAGAGLERRFLDLPAAFKAGGSVQLRFRFSAGAAPSSAAGVWLDDLSLVCAQTVGQASAYALLEGTSMAAPHVSGAAGLLFSLEPGATVTNVREALLAGVDAIPSLAGKTSGGGRLDVAKAMDSLEGDVVDHTAPAKPVLAGTVPASGSNDNNPRLKGSAEAGAIVTLFKSPNCSGGPVASGTAEELAGPGIGVTVPDNFIAFFSAQAIDAARNKSACSAPTSYLEDSPPPVEVPPDTEVPTSFGPGVSPAPSFPSPAPLPTCTVPKLVGKTLAQAKAALAGARCPLGRVIKPRPRKGQRPPSLVVKSSTPAAGTATTGPVSLNLGPKPRVKKPHR
jgi:subtilisin family serine protease